jgi:uncharacterized protein (DUF2147 family)
MSIKPASDAKLAGTAYDRKRNLTYSLELTVEKAFMTSRGCILAGLVCKNVSWTRAR